MHRSLLLAGGLLLSAVLGIVAASPAAAHQLVSSSPGAGARLSAAPSQVTLVFSQPVFGMAAVFVTGPDGNAARGWPQVSGYRVVQQLSRGLGTGTYTVSWRLSSYGGGFGDSGSFRFTVAPTPTATKAVVTPTRTPTPTKRAAATPSKPAATSMAPPTTSPTPQLVVVPDPTTTTTVPEPTIAGVSSTDRENLPGPLFWWLLLGGLGCLGYGIFRARRTAHAQAEVQVREADTAELPLVAMLDAAAGDSEHAAGLPAPLLGDHDPVSSGR